MLFNPKISIDFQDVMKGLSGLETTDLEQLVEELKLVIRRRKMPSFAQQEAVLVHKIKEGGPDIVFRRRFQSLTEQLEQETISPREHEELSAMIPISEQWTVTRLRYLIELSELWGISVEASMQKLELVSTKSIPV